MRRFSGGTEYRQEKEEGVSLLGFYARLAFILVSPIVTYFLAVFVLVFGLPAWPADWDPTVWKEFAEPDDRWRMRGDLDEVLREGRTRQSVWASLGNPGGGGPEDDGQHYVDRWLIAESGVADIIDEMYLYVTFRVASDERCTLESWEIWK